MTGIPTPLGYDRGPLAPNYAAYGVTPPTPEQSVKLAEQAIRLDAEKYGAWPNPAKEPNRLENWRGRMTHRMRAYLKAFEIHESEWSQMIVGYKATMEAEKRFDWAYAKELADAEIGIRTRSKGQTVTDDIPGGDMTKKQAQHHSATAEQVASAKEAFAKALAVPPVSPEVQAKAEKLSAALSRIDSEMSYRDVDLTLRRNVFRRYDGATCEKVVVHPNYNQLTVEGEYRAEVTRVRNPIPLIDDQQNDDEIAEAAARANAEEKTGKALLDEHFPRGNGTAKPSDEAPAHWSKDPAKLRKFYGDVKGYCNKYPQFRELHAAKVSEFVHDAIYFDHLDQTPLDPNETLKVVKAYADKKFSQSTVEKPTPQDLPKAENNTPPPNDEPGTLQETKQTEVIPPEKPDAPQIAQNAPNLNGTEKKPEFEPSPILCEVKTLMGIPMSQLGKVLNRPHDPSYYSEIEAKKKGEKWTDIDPIAVRIRFDKVFGPQGFGWRIVPVQGIGRVNYELGTFKRKDQSEYTKHVVTLEGFALEYGIVINGQITYVQTSAMSDSDNNDDRGYAYRGAFTSLMKQALKNFGGFDHFVDV